MLFSVALFRVALRCVVFRRIALCCAALRCVALLCCVKVFWRYALYMAFGFCCVEVYGFCSCREPESCVAIRRVAFRCDVLRCLVLYCVALHSFVLRCDVLCRAAFRFAVLY